MANRTHTTRERTVLTAEQDAKAAHMRAEGRTYRAIAETLGARVPAELRPFGLCG